MKNFWPKDPAPRAPDKASFRIKGRRVPIDVWPDDRPLTFRQWFLEVTETAKRLGVRGELTLVYRGQGHAMVEVYDLEPPEKEGKTR